MEAQGRCGCDPKYLPTTLYFETLLSSLLSCNVTITLVNGIIILN